MSLLRRCMFDEPQANGGAVTNLDFARGGSPHFSAAKSNTLPPRGSPHPAKKLSCCACEIASECSPVNFAPFFLRCL